MKTGNVSQGTVFLKQAKSTREEKAPGRSASLPPGEKVDLSSKTHPDAPNVPPTYDEVLELLYGIDYSQIKNIDWISLQGRTGLMEML